MNWIKHLFNKKEIEYTQISKGWNADPVSPDVILTIKGNDLLMDIYLNYYAFENFKKGDRVQIKFKDCAEYSLNNNNDEGYYNGQYRISPKELPWGEFYQIQNGIDIKYPEPVVRLSGYKLNCNHYIFFFKDETFECLASGFELKFYKEND